VQILEDESSSDIAEEGTLDEDEVSSTHLTIILEDMEGVSRMSTARQAAFEEWIASHSRAASVHEPNSERWQAVSVKLKYMQELAAVPEVQEPNVHVPKQTFWEDLWDGKVSTFDVLVKGGLAVFVLYQFVNLLEGVAEGSTIFSKNERKEKDEAASQKNDDVATLLKDMEDVEDEGFESSKKPIILPEVSEKVESTAVAGVSDASLLPNDEEPEIPKSKLRQLAMVCEIQSQGRLATSDGPAAVPAETAVKRIVSRLVSGLRRSESPISRCNLPETGLNATAKLGVTTGFENPAWKTLPQMYTIPPLRRVSAASGSMEPHNNESTNAVSKVQKDSPFKARQNQLATVSKPKNSTQMPSRVLLWVSSAMDMWLLKGVGALAVTMNSALLPVVVDGLATSLILQVLRHVAVEQARARQRAAMERGRPRSMLRFLMPAPWMVGLAAVAWLMMDRPSVQSWMRTDLTTKTAASTNVTPPAGAETAAVTAGASGAAAPASTATAAAGSSAAGSDWFLHQRQLRSLLKETAQHEMPFSDFLRLVDEDQIQAVDFQPENKLHVILFPDVYSPNNHSDAKSALYKAKPVVVNCPPGESAWYKANVVNKLLRHRVLVQATPAATNVLLSLLFNFGPTLFLCAIMWQTTRMVWRMQAQASGIEQQEHRLGEQPDTTLDDVAGCDEAKAELAEVVDYLMDPQRYEALGARAPRGVLLVGPPGTGKTLLAKAIAGEAKVPFFSCAGSEFVEMFVGVGASRVRNLFSMARKAAPCIIFIDEFDALGASRTLRSGSGMMGGEESTNTINQMLTEMDGFEDNTGIVVLAATNRPAVLDEALTRPGRFDRILHLPLPGIQGRVQILQVHARNKSIVGDVDWERIARGCAGWTGADIMNLMNEAAITAIREGLENVEERHIVDALEKLKRDAISAGGQKVETAGGKSSDAEEIGPLLQTSICLHEAGRALIGYLTPYFDDLQKVTVFPGGRPTGHTSFVPQESHLESGVMTRGYLTSQMVVCLAGRAAEKLILGEDLVSTAATTHLADANLIARQMVMRFGFSERIGPVSLMGGHDEVYLRTDRAQVAVADISPETAEVVLEEVIALIEAAEAKAMYGLKENRELLIALSERLKKEHTLTGAEVEAMCEEHGAKPYWDVSLKGFEWDKEGNLVYPERPAEAAN